VKAARKFRGRRGERGYALLMVAFAATLMLIAAMTVAPGIKANRRREKEKEMIWRGNQYVRGIMMYYRKYGKYPTSLDDLMKPQINNVRFMRQAYKDPMNKQDGSWRLIYIGPSGQLIGSLKPRPALALPVGIPGAAGVGTPAANLPGAGINSFNTQGPLGAAGAAGAQQGTIGTTPTTGSGVSTDTDANGNTLPPEVGTIIGGSIVGVGSKTKGHSVIFYDKATDYHLFEFIWDPSKTPIGVGRQVAPGTQIPGTSTPGTPVSPFGNPGTGGTNPPLSNPPQQNQPQN
jgi:hypothetical protein